MYMKKTQKMHRVFETKNLTDCQIHLPTGVVTGRDVVVKFPKKVRKQWLLNDECYKYPHNFFHLSTMNINQKYSYDVVTHEHVTIFVMIKKGWNIFAYVEHLCLWGSLSVKLFEMRIQIKVA